MGECSVLVLNNDAAKSILGREYRYLIVTSRKVGKGRSQQAIFQYLALFFIVLDLRLTKDWLSGKIAFFIFSLPSPPNSVTAKNATKWKRQKQRRITCKNRGSITGQCFSHIRKHVFYTYAPYSYTYVQTHADVYEILYVQNKIPHQR